MCPAVSFFLLIALLIFFIRHRFAPFGTCPLGRNGNGNVLKPTVGGSSMPMFYFGRNVHYVAGFERTCRLAPLLIPAAATYADEDLSAFVVYVPVVATMPP